ncbi:MAG: iron ABC transporter permease [Alphaproteobacteria bacterium]|nr:iron ABC transporter permease [Alphaproteobacteria bacterium]
MSADINRRRLIAATLGLALPAPLHAQSYTGPGYAGLGRSAEGFRAVTPGKVFSFPADHGPHPDYRIEWWYLTANLHDSTGRPFGLQWTLFRQALTPGPQEEGWANRALWMGHAAVTSSHAHRFAERFARGGVGQADVVAKPFHAWIDGWEMKGQSDSDDQSLSPLTLSASGPGFSFSLRLEATHPVVLQGDHGFSRKSPGGAASYYYSQPFFHARGRLTIDNQVNEVDGPAWMDREWSSKALAADQSGWDWMALHLEGGDRLMLYRLRQQDGSFTASGNWITAAGDSTAIAASQIAMTPIARHQVAGRSIPHRWHIAIPAQGLAIDCEALNPDAWMATRIAYWEGPITITGSHVGVGYLEMTGY